MRKTQESLVERLRRGEPAAAAELVDIYYKQIFLFMRRLGHTPQVSEDLTQDSFLQAWQHIGQLRDGKALNAWLYRIAGNVSKLYWRRNKGKRAAQIEGSDVCDSTETSNEKAGNDELLRHLDKAVKSLPEKLRQTIVLHYLQHLTIAEAAEVAGVRQGTFKSRLNRALKALRTQIA